LNKWDENIVKILERSLDDMAMFDEEENK